LKLTNTSCCERSANNPKMKITVYHDVTNTTEDLKKTITITVIKKFFTGFSLIFN